MFRTALILLSLTSTALADTWTVDDDGKADFDNIQAAVDAASNGDEIIVAPGTYTSTASEVVNMLGKEIWLHSSKGAEVTIIDGEETRRGIYCANGETSNTIIEGLAIKNGYYAGYSNSGGGGVHCANANPKLFNLIIENNNSGWTDYDDMAGVCYLQGGCGGGLYAEGGSGILEIINCVFIGNKADGRSQGAGAYTIGKSAGQIHFTDCEFINNYFDSIGCNYNSGYTSRGCGAFSNGNVDYSGCTFTNNATPTGIWGNTFNGGGLYGGGIVSNCTFIDNTSDNGGGLYGGGIISNCTFIDNVASLKGANAYGGTSYTSCTFSGGRAIEGGGLALLNICTISDCSFSDNIATDLGGSIFIGSSVVDIQNSTFCNSSPNHIEGSWTDNGNNEFFEVCGIGACCTSNHLTCVEAPGIVCIQFGLEFLGEGTTCENASCVTSCPGDMNGDGNVDVSDLMILIAYWGACP
jgi:hypothetical protein